VTVKGRLAQLGFWTVQASALLVFAVPFERQLVVVWLVSHFVRAVGLTLVFHRHMAHRAFEMNRIARFVWAFFGTAAMQKGPIWWAGHHIDHHRYADRDGDPHSPWIGGFYRAHIGWFLDDVRYDELPEQNPVVRKFSSFPEIRWLDRFYMVPPLLWALALLAVGGVSWLIWGFCLATVTLAHSTFAINTVNHMWGSRRFATRDRSTNNPITALLAAGEGWHNNHHRFPGSARNGFYWWEFDITYAVIVTMRRLGLVWNLRPVPDTVYREAEEQRVARQRTVSPPRGS
jgi:stearoyl-CoA desaturase (delta-9 desaturase)